METVTVGTCFGARQVWVRFPGSVTFLPEPWFASLENGDSVACLAVSLEVSGRPQVQMLRKEQALWQGWLPHAPPHFPPTPKHEATMTVLAGPCWNNYTFVPGLT